MKYRTPEQLEKEMAELAATSPYAVRIIRKANAISQAGFCDADPVDLIKASEYIAQAHMLRREHLAFLIDITAATLVLSTESFMRAFEEASMPDGEVDMRVVNMLLDAMKEKENGSYTEQ